MEEVVDLVVQLHIQFICGYQMKMRVGNDAKTTLKFLIIV